MRISATVITFNEEHNIADALKSLRWADEIIVVDSESNDRTLEIARQFTDRIFVNPWPGYAAQKNFAAAQARFDWIFNLDADERVSDELAREIDRLSQQQELDTAGYEMPRKTYYLGRWIRHSGWYPDLKLRLYRRGSGGFQGDYVHESVKVSGKIERLKGEILHYTVRYVSEHHTRLDRYTTLAAEEQIERGEDVSFASLLLSPAIAFIRSYIIRLGFLDGIPGLAIAYFAAHYVFLKKLKVWEARQSRAERD
jgi:glycosyltransferase involved in cell wall biosynthesis